MKIEKVTYQKTYSIGPYLTDKVGLEASIDAGESAADVLDNLRAAADEWHKGEHPHLYQEESKPSSQPIGIIHVENTPADGDEALALIKNAPSLEILSTFRLIAGSGNEALYTAYNKRVRELTNGKQDQ